jgi:hypothetical protein
MPKNTKGEIVNAFKKHVLPGVIEKHGQDKAAIRTAWNDYVDHMQKHGEITEHQAKTWTNPFDN